jgi:type IV secretion system protein VirB4
VDLRLAFQHPEAAVMDDDEMLVSAMKAWIVHYDDEIVITSEEALWCKSSK